MYVKTCRQGVKGWGLTRTPLLPYKKFCTQPGQTGWRKFKLIRKLSKLWWLRATLNELLLQKHEAIFQKELGTLKGIRAKLEVILWVKKVLWCE